MSQTLILDQTWSEPILATAWSKAENVGGGRNSDYSLYLDLTITGMAHRYEGRYLPRAAPGYYIPLSGMRLSISERSSTVKTSAFSSISRAFSRCCLAFSDSLSFEQMRPSCK